jgi:hypothetical protein
LDIIHGLYVQSESANIALEHKFLRKQEALIVPLILLLSLSMSSCIRPLISLLQFPLGFLQKLLPVIQRRSIFPAPSSAMPPSQVELHQCQPPCPLLHTPHSLENKSAMHFHATMMGRRHNKTVDAIMPKIQD